MILTYFLTFSCSLTSSMYCFTCITLLCLAKATLLISFSKCCSLLNYVSLRFSSIRWSFYFESFCLVHFGKSFQSFHLGTYYCSDLMFFREIFLVLSVDMVWFCVCFFLHAKHFPNIFYWFCRVLFQDNPGI
uniref:Uncharacterized protein n=1 Tax=Cacopsylla melanoneura TaxID=428564 RepID=A0A8D8ZFF0_9HEMI